MKTISIYNGSIQVEAKGDCLERGWLNADNLGIAASALCVVHCLALPVLAITLPAVAITHAGAGGDMTHQVLAAFVVAFCLFAIVPGYRQHRHQHVLFGMLSGVFLVLFATFAAEPLFGDLGEMSMITIGNFIVVAAHLRNRKLLAAATNATAKCC